MVFLLNSEMIRHLNPYLLDAAFKVDVTGIKESDEPGSGFGRVVRADEFQLLIVANQTGKTGSYHRTRLEM